MTFVEPNVQVVLQNMGHTSKSDAIVVSEERAQTIWKYYQMQNEMEGIRCHLLERWLALEKRGIIIESYQKVGYEMQYICKRADERVGLKYWFNGKGVFKANWMAIPSKTNSEELLKDLTEYLNEVVPVRVALSGEIPKSFASESFEFEEAIAEESPYLKALYDTLSECISGKATIKKIEHLSYRERYTFADSVGICVVDFQYNSQGFFSRVLPLDKECSSQKLLGQIRAIITQLKN